MARRRGHPLGAHREDERHNDRKAFWNDRNRGTDRELEEERRFITTEHAERADGHDAHENDEGDQTCEARELPLERRLRLGLGSSQVSDLAEFGSTTRTDDDADAATTRDDRAEKRHTNTISDRCFGWDGIGAFDHWNRFAGKNRLVHRECCGRNEPKVGRNADP
jgi:hypothetical protein